jgi:pyrroloquinoline quinone biosynthesis protein B
MIRLGLSTKTARDIGHLPQSGADGMIALLGRYQKPRKVLIHINNTNPILDEDSPERAELTRAGIELAFDGMLIDTGDKK